MKNDEQRILLSKLRKSLLLILFKRANKLMAGFKEYFKSIMF
jgi:hypothetical protein